MLAEKYLFFADLPQIRMCICIFKAKIKLQFPAMDVLIIMHKLLNLMPFRTTMLDEFLQEQTECCFLSWRQPGTGKALEMFKLAAAEKPAPFGNFDLWC